MSQLENLMLLALGFSVAILLALLFGRLAWNVAVKLGQRRRNIDAPAELLELQADRDRLRAEYAVLSRKLELRLDDLKARLVEQMAEVSRNRNRIMSLMEEVKVRDAALERKSIESQVLSDRRQTLETDLSGKTAELENLRETGLNQEVSLAEAKGQVQILTAALADRDQQIAALRGALLRDRDHRAAEPVVEVQDTQSSQERLQRRISELSKLSADIADQRVALKEERDMLDHSRKAPARLAEPAQRYPEPAARLQELLGGPQPVAMEPLQVPQPFEARLDAAMREADQLSSELKRLDELWALKQPPVIDDISVAAQLKSVSGGGQRKAAGMANVISLAQRIRALKNDLGG